MIRSSSVRELSLCAMLAAAYAVLTLVLPVPQYAGLQLRLAEGLTVLPFLIPKSTGGLFVGCLMANVFSPYGLLDMVAGSGATLLACLWTARLKDPRFAPIPAAVCNALVMGGVIAFTMTGFGPGFWTAFALNALSIAAGELIVGYSLGSILLRVLPGIAPFRALMPQEKR